MMDTVAGKNKYSSLPPAVRLEDTVVEVPAEQAVRPELGGITETEFLLRHVG